MADLISNHLNLNRRLTVIYIITAVVIYAAMVSFFLFRGKFMYAGLLVGLPAIGYLATQPKLALYFLILSLFVSQPIAPNSPIWSNDIGAGVVILAAILDVFIRNERTSSFPRLSYNYMILIGAVGLAGIFGNNFSLSFFPLARITVLFLLFLSIYRLSYYIKPLTLLRFFFFATALYATTAISAFIASGGRIRSFGILPSTTLDDFTMVALPIGLGLFLWAKRNQAWIYFIGTIIVLGGLLATQSRATFFFTLFASLVLFILAWRYGGEYLTDSESLPGGIKNSLIRTRIKALLIGGIAAFGFIVVLKATVFNTLMGRFENVMTTTPGGTFQLRLVLWKEAFTAFTMHPLFGIGPGNFRSIGTIIPTLHMNPLNYYVRGLSAHNLFLHYLAETGIVGASALAALFINQFRIALSGWRKAMNSPAIQLSSILLVLATVMMVTTFLEAAWMWGDVSMLGVMVIALAVRNQNTLSGVSQK
jgi:O-antigen ligase